MTEPRKPTKIDDELPEETVADLEVTDADAVQGGAVATRPCSLPSDCCVT